MLEFYLWRKLNVTQDMVHGPNTTADHTVKKYFVRFWSGDFSVENNTRNDAEILALLDLGIRQLVANRGTFKSSRQSNDYVHRVDMSEFLMIRPTTIE